MLACLVIPYLQMKLLQMRATWTLRESIEMKVGKDFPPFFDVLDEYGNKFTFRVEYSWDPRSCSSCSVFGVTTSHCPNSGQIVAAQQSSHATLRPLQKPIVSSNNFPVRLPATTPPVHTQLSEAAEEWILVPERTPISPTNLENKRIIIKEKRKQNCKS